MPLPASLDRLARQSIDLRDRLTRWANINSGSAHLAGLERMREMLTADFSRLAGVTVESVALPETTAHALRLRCRPQAARQILLSGHYDTVYDATHPFQTCDLSDPVKLRGPGVADMKGGLMVMLAALEAFEQTDAASQFGWEALLTPDEEIGSPHSADVIAETARHHRFALVFEPARANGDLVRSRMGTGVCTVTCRGREAHAGHVPNEGRNAIAALAEFLVAAHRLPEDMPGVMLNIGQIEGGGTVNIVPAFAQARINIRITRATDAANVRSRLEQLAAQINAREGYTLELAGGFDSPPKECSPVEEKLFALLQDTARSLGLALFSWVHSGGGSDGNRISAAGCPNLDGLGPIGGHLHSDQEYCLVPSLGERAQLTAVFLHRLATGEIALP